MTKTYSRFLSALFCLFLGGLLVWHLVLPDRAQSETENRTLSQLPAFSWAGLKDGSFTQGVEDYFADQFPLRDDWTGLKARTEQLVGKREFHNVYLCGDTLISKVSKPDMTLVEKNLSYVQALAEKTDARVYLGMIPSAAEIWKDKLPDGAESWDQTALLSHSQIAFQEVLAAHAGEDIFYRTDHHWTTLGAYYGYTAVMKALGREADILPASHFAPETVTEDFCGTLYSQSGIHWLTPDRIQRWVAGDGLTVTSWRTGSPEPSGLYDDTFLEKKDKYASFLGGNQPLCVIQNPAVSDGSKLLIVRDSYSDALAPFLSQNFAEIHLMDPRYYRMSPAQYAADHGISEIAVIYSTANFITDKNLVFLTQ